MKPARRRVCLAIADPVSFVVDLIYCIYEKITRFSLADRCYSK